MVLATACVFFCLVATASAATNSPALTANDGFNDGIDRTDPNFVKASLLIFGPGKELFSSVGHVAIRLECSTFDLDFCFSYEGERIAERLPKFFAGQLKMGLFAIPTEEMLALCRESGRGVTQYPMNLPANAKQELWRILDGRAEEGAELPYDYLARGCAKAAYDCLLEALENAGCSYTFAGNGPTASLTQRERVDREMQVSRPWNLFFLHAIGSVKVDTIDPIVLPSDLLFWAKSAKVAGLPVVSGSGEVILSPAGEKESAGITPLSIAGLFLVLAVFAFFIRNGGIDGLFLAVQSLLGLFVTYLVLAFWMPNAGWNWLIVPFNLLPLIFWKWRRRWALPFAGVLLLWELFMLLSPHRLTDPAYLVLVAAYVVLYAKIGLRDARRPAAMSLERKDKKNE